MFQLTEEEVSELNRSQFVTGSQKYRDPRFRPYASTEQGVAMWSSVLRSKRANGVNVEIMRTFVKLRQLLTSNAELSRKLADLEKKSDHQFKIVFEAIRQLMTTRRAITNRLGFVQRHYGRVTVNNEL